MPAGTSAGTQPSSNPSITCYGCGAPGVIRSNCPKCSNSNRNGPPRSSLAAAEFLCSSFLNDNCARPVVPITILGHTGYAFLDTGATTNIAGSRLAQILIEDEVPYTEAKDLDMVLADGVKRKVQALIYNIPVSLYDRTTHVQLVAIPEHVNSRTLLGAEFISAMKLVLDLNNNSFQFADCSNITYSCISEDDVTTTAINVVSLSNALRKDEAVKLQPEERQQLDSLLTDNATVFEPSLEPTPFAEHTIVLQDDSPIAVPPYRMSAGKKELLRKELDVLLENGTIEECESPYAAPVVLVPKKDGKTCSWFRRVIEGFAQVAKPLTSLTKKNAKWESDEPQATAFQKLKTLLSTAPILRQADPRLPYVLRTDASSYLMSNGILYRYNPDTDEEEPQLVIGTSQITDILHEYHDSPTAGHYGIERTLQRISRRFYWPGMRKSIAEYVGRCIECQRFKATNLKPAGLFQTPVQSQRFEVIAIDLFGPLRKNWTKMDVSGLDGRWDWQNCVDSLF
ncbi:uncharacterized protein LOC109534254 isoform X3 [Dendroctonus ponderosae]|uniref:uncharacterized protein LOC109534254 isoform X3 n=1 Tax=Dendroctonus ponderosae TaxID=77166 RepID=UPI00203617C5|nr:uncharacterized protein LOC109534254 isoform X3 [Dendroctonus ponderosae]